MTVTEQPQDTIPATPQRPTRRWLWLVVLLVGVSAAAVVLSTGFGRDPTVVQSVLLDGPAPPLAGPTLDGGTFDLADHRGEVVVVNVWASWCDPCRDEYPVLAAAARELGPRGVQFVGINTQDGEGPARRFLEELGGEPYPSVVDPDGRLAVKWGTFGIPETFVVDRDGQLVAKAIGVVTPQWFMQNIVPLLDAP